MEILRFWRSGLVVLLIFISIAAYKSIAIEPALKELQKQCCSKEMDCPPPKTNTPGVSGSSIIWDSMADNLLSSHI